MPNESLEYRLGCIDTKLEQNDDAHKTMLTVLNKISCDLDVFKMKSIEDVALIRGKASVWGAIMGFIVSAVITLAGWTFSIHK